jgi:hypothetical protein
MAAVARAIASFVISPREQSGSRKKASKDKGSIRSIKNYPVWMCAMLPRAKTICNSD